MTEDEVRLVPCLLPAWRTDAGLHEGGRGDIASDHANSLLSPAVRLENRLSVSAHIVDEDPPIDLAPLRQPGPIRRRHDRPSCKTHR